MPFAVIDEVQKVLQLLDEVHWLHKNRGVHFALCGSSGIEVDFIINDMEIAIEAKAAHRISTNHVKDLQQVRKDHPEIKRLIAVCCEEKPRRTEDGIEILPAQHFARLLWNNKIF